MSVLVSDELAEIVRSTESRLAYVEQLQNRPDLNADERLVAFLQYALACHQEGV